MKTEISKSTFKLIVRLAKIMDKMKIIHKLTGRKQIIILEKKCDFKTLSELEKWVEGSRFLTKSWSIEREYCIIKILRNE